MIKPRIGCYAVYEPPEEGWENWEQQFSQINQELAGQGLEIIVAPEAVKDLDSLARVSDFFSEQNVDMLHALIITWSFDHYTIELLQRFNVPVAIRAIPGIRTGSVVGAQQLASVLTDLEQPYHLYYGEIGDVLVAQSVAVYAKACAIRSRLRRARLGVIGRRTEGMTPTAVDEIEILRLFGVRLINYGLDELLERAELISQEEASESWLRFRSAALSGAG